MGKSYVLAVAGGGGKTTLIGQLAENGRLGGKKTVVMTTTHMWLPNGYSAVGKTAEAAAEQMEQDGLVYYGAAEPGTGKMVFPGQEAYEYLCRRADLVLLEADGSKGLPMKVPDWSREPVIPCNTDGIIVVFGLSAVGKPAGEVCQRLELGRKWLEEDQGLEPGKRWLEENQGLEHLCVTEELAELFLENGYLKPLRFRFPNAHRILLLNQADSAWREAAGMRMKTRLEAKGWECRVEQLRRIKVSV
ncbi:MAG: selenium cofactor biosynthesis protein YqeC, partial [Lachnospiraceae bacterium]|nr:selenium cofactor biosynthesis protein YqeC [Lachnospiraceae bacterium]